MAADVHSFEDPEHRIAHVVAGPSWVEHGAEALCSLALVAMILLIGAEAIVRNLFGGSLQIVDEVGGYLLVLITFLSMSVAEAHGSFHRVELVQARMGPRARTWLQVVFDLCALATSALITWQLGRLAVKAWYSGNVAPTPLQTPLWFPQLFMGVGTALLCYALARSVLAKLRHLREGAAS